MSRRRMFAVFWALALAVPTGLELAGLLSPGDWDTLSDHVIPFVLSHPTVWVLSLAFYIGGAVWLAWHWWFEYRGRR